MSKRFLAIYDEKDNTYLNNCFSTNNLEMIKKFDTLNIECSIVEINKELFEFLQEKSKTDQSEWISPDGFTPTNYKIPYCQTGRRQISSLHKYIYNCFNSNHTFNYHCCYD